MITAMSEIEEHLGAMNKQDLEIILTVLRELPECSYGSPGGLTLKQIAVAVGQARKDMAKRYCSSVDIPVDESVTCDVCRRSVPDLDTAIKQGWIPETWYSDNEPGPAPVCGECDQRFFHDPPCSETEVRPPGQWLC